MSSDIKNIKIQPASIDQASESRAPEPLINRIFGPDMVAQNAERTPARPDGADRPQQRRSLSAIDRILAQEIEQALRTGNVSRMQGLVDCLPVHDTHSIDRILSIVAGRLGDNNVELSWERGTEVRKGVPRPFVSIEVNASRPLGSFQVNFRSDREPTFTCRTLEDIKHTTEYSLRRIFGR
jgi:hypothetical protein